MRLSVLIYKIEITQRVVMIIKQESSKIEDTKYLIHAK